MKCFHSSAMPPFSACGTQELVQDIKKLDKRIIALSPHYALLFRQRMNDVLSAAPRINPAGSHNGIFSGETTLDIVRQAAELIRCLQLPIRVEWHGSYACFYFPDVLLKEGT